MRFVIRIFKKTNKVMESTTKINNWRKSGICFETKETKHQDMTSLLTANMTFSSWLSDMKMISDFSVKTEYFVWTYLPFLQRLLNDDYSKQKKDLSKLFRVNNGVYKNAPITYWKYTLLLLPSSQTSSYSMKASLKQRKVHFYHLVDCNLVNCIRMIADNLMDEAEDTYCCTFSPSSYWSHFFLPNCAVCNKKIWSWKSIASSTSETNLLF